MSVCGGVTGSNQSEQATPRSRLSSSDAFTQRQGPTCACLFHAVAAPVSSRISHSVRVYSSISPRLTSPGPGLHLCPFEASWKSPRTTGSVPVLWDSHHPAAHLLSSVLPVQPCAHSHGKTEFPRSTEFKCTATVTRFLRAPLLTVKSKSLSCSLTFQFQYLLFQFSEKPCNCFFWAADLFFSDFAG